MKLLKYLFVLFVILSFSVGNVEAQRMYTYGNQSPQFYGTTNFGSTTSGANVNINATLGSDLITWDESAWNEDDSTWTMTTTGPLVHVTGNTTAITGTVTGALTAGVTYKVTIAGTGGTATATYTLGGRTGTTLAASGAIAIVDYITALADSEFVITPANTCTVSITSVTVKALTDATGDVTVDGNLRVYSPSYFYGRIYGNPGNGVLSLGRMTLSDNANEDGITFGSLGTATKGIDLSSSGLSGATDYFFYGATTDYWQAGGNMAISGISAIGSSSNAISIRTDNYLPRFDTISNAFQFIGQANTSKNNDHGNQTNPTIYMQSALNPDVSNNQWGSFTHDQEDFVITTGVNIGTGSAPTTDENGVKIFPRGGSAGLHVKGNGNVAIGTTEFYSGVTTLTTSQVNNCRGTPITVVAAQGANTWIELVSAVITYDYATAAFTVGADEDLVIEYADGTDTTASIETAGFLDQADDEVRFYPTSLTAGADPEATVGQALRIFNTGSGETADGGGEVDVRITYRVYNTGF